MVQLGRPCLLNFEQESLDSVLRAETRRKKRMSDCFDRAAYADVDPPEYQKVGQDKVIQNCSENRDRF